MKRNKARYIATLAMMITISLMLSYVETFIPAIPIPGAKIGLPNVVTLIAICTLGFVEALIILVVRAVISSLLFSSMISLAYSIAGGILSLIIMYLMHKILKDKISLVSISITGAIVHNLGQLSVAILILESLKIATMLPWLIVVAIPAGIFVGFAAKYLLKYFKSTIHIKGT